MIPSTQNVSESLNHSLHLYVLLQALINERVAHTEPSKLTMNTLLGLLYLAMCFTNPAYTIGDLRR